METKPSVFRKRVAYVSQDDALFATSTCREALEFSARLRLPNDLTKEQRDLLVNDMITSLGLTKCANTMVGSELVRGLSGGEKKRVAIGVELVSNPSCLFLDEPTSGKRECPK
jgi:ATP-binding cassette subfamily G (WHITE) protein 2